MPKKSCDDSENNLRDVSSSWYKKSRVAVAVYAAIFLLCIQSKCIQSIILYVHLVNFPFWLSDTAYHGLPDARNIANGSVVNGWHLLPAGETATRSALLTDPELREQYFDAALRQADSIVLSLHGNAGNRGTKDRVAEDRMLASQASVGNCHVLAIDYRGFGESTGWPSHWPSEESTAEDTGALWSWLESLLLSGQQQREEKSGKDEKVTGTPGDSLDDTCASAAQTSVSSDTEGSRSSCSARGDTTSKLPKVFIYGHSLGCAISTQLASHLSSRRGRVEDQLEPAGLILVSPFTSAPEVARDYPYTAFLRLVPYATDMIAHFLHFTYSNTEAITSVTCPILVIHGVEDGVTLPKSHLFSAAYVCHVVYNVLLGVVPVEHGTRLTETYVNSFPTPCVATVYSLVTGDAYNGTHFECISPSPSSVERGVTGEEKTSEEPLLSRVITFVEVQNAGHNWVFTRREWLATVPDFINRYS